MKFNSTSNTPTKPTGPKEKFKVKYNSTTGLFSNPNRTVAFQNYNEAEIYNQSIDKTPINKLNAANKPRVSPGVNASNTPFQNTLKNIQKKPNVPIGKPRKETMTERIERMTYEYSGDEIPKDKRPKHMDNPLIVSDEDWAKRPKPFKSEDPSSYPMNQGKTLSLWEIMVNDAKNPKDKYDRESAASVKKTIWENYNKPNMRQYLGDDELKLIGKHKSQTAKKILEDVKKTIEIPSIDINYKPYVPTPPQRDAMEVIEEKSRFKPGLTKDLLRLNEDINENIKYVLGEKEEKSESVNERNQTNEEETYD